MRYLPMLKYWFKSFNSKTKSTERQKPSFPTEFVENADLDKPIYTNEWPH